jgi:hypothetical protein
MMIMMMMMVVVVVVVMMIMMMTVVDDAQVWLWYLSVTLLTFMLSFLLLRFLAFIILWICGYEYW